MHVYGKSTQPLAICRLKFAMKVETALTLFQVRLQYGAIHRELLKLTVECIQIFGEFSGVLLHIKIINMGRFTCVRLCYLQFFFRFYGIKYRILYWTLFIPHTLQTSESEFGFWVSLIYSISDSYSFFHIYSIYNQFSVKPAY